MTFAAKLFWLALLLAGFVLLVQRSHGAVSTADMIPQAVVVVPSVRAYHFAATATDTNGLESDYSQEAVLTVSNRLCYVTCAWDAPAGSNSIAFYTLFQGAAAGGYTNSVRVTNQTQATIRVNPPVPSNLVVTVTSSGCTNLQYRQLAGASWTGWALLGCTNLVATNPAYAVREWRGIGRPSSNKRVYIEAKYL